MATEPYVINELLTTEAGRIGSDIHNRSLFMSPYLSLWQSEEFPEEMGATVSVLIYERSLPTYPISWAPIGYSSDPTTNGGTSTQGGTCLPPIETVAFAQTLRQYNLNQMALQSPPMCVNDLRVAFKRKEQLSSIMNVLTDNTGYAWINRYRDEYTRLAGHQMIASVSGGFPDGLGAGFPLVTPTSTLTDGFLQKIYQKLIRNGAGKNALARENGRPVFTLITDSETSNNIIMQNQATRQDFRWSKEVEDLLRPLGVERSYRGFFHLIDDLPARWDFVAGAWVRRWPYTNQSVTMGQGAFIDPVYEAAAYTDSVVFVREAMSSMVPRPLTNPGGNTKFDPLTYKGEFKWLNIPHANDNPDGTIGFFRGVFAQGTKAVFPDYAFVVRHIRCDVPVADVSCQALQYVS